MFATSSINVLCNIIIEGDHSQASTPDSDNANHLSYV